MEEKQTVIAIKTDKIIIESAVLVDNEWHIKSRLSMPLKGPMPSVRGEYSGQENVSISDKTINCLIIKQPIADRDGKKQFTKTWFSKEVPGGVVKITQDDTVILELVDFSKKSSNYLAE